MDAGGRQTLTLSPNVGLAPLNLPTTLTNMAHLPKLAKNPHSIAVSRAFLGAPTSQEDFR